MGSRKGPVTQPSRAPSVPKVAAAAPVLLSMTSTTSAPTSTSTISAPTTTWTAREPNTTLRPSERSQVVSAGDTRSDSVSMYCFTLLLPFGNERELVKVQYERTLSIFNCDEHTTFSNESFELSPGRPNGEWTVAIEGDMAVAFNTWTWEKYGTKMALNT